MKELMIAVALGAGFTGVAYAVEGASASGAELRIEEAVEVAPVVSDFPVNFSLLTVGERQFAAYYDKDRNMTVASRALGSDEWKYRVLPSKVGWDSHNYVTMAADGEGHVHLSGNMHNVDLVYFRTQKPGDIETFERVAMTGEEESRVTYPRFLRDHEERLLFTYRHGGSGNGSQIYNQYDLEAQSWSRLLDSPLLDGEDLRSAYPAEPVRGPDGFFHMIWVWRDTPDCATNNHLSYARSRDMIHWESAFGEGVELPLTLGDSQLWVDPIPSGGGIINGGAKLAFDREKRPVISYHKNDSGGNMQIFLARPGDGKWSSRQVTRWEKPVEFSGKGSMGFIGIRVGALEQAEAGFLVMSYQHRDYGDGMIVVNEETLEPVEKEIPLVGWIPKELESNTSGHSEMEIRRQSDSGFSGDAAARYFLQWETLPTNRDQIRPSPLPEPTKLMLYKVARRR